MEYTIRKEKMEIEPTQKAPCGNEYFQSCADFQLNRLIQEKYSCHVPFLYTGSHTEQNWSLPICTNQETLEALQLSANITDLCDQIVPCQLARYHRVSLLHKDISYVNTVRAPWLTAVIIRFFLYSWPNFSSKMK